MNRRRRERRRSGKRMGYEEEDILPIGQKRFLPQSDLSLMVH